MNVKILKDTFVYDGSQLSPLYLYLNHQLLGSSVLIGCGPCNVKMDHMIDGEDVLLQAKIKSDNMVHFLFELFDFPLKAAIGLQRLISTLAIETIIELSSMEISKQLVRKGDDIYWQGDKKFNISIATCSSNSSLIHYAVNITNKGTPVKTCCLDDFSIETEDFILSLSKKIKNEWDSIIKASCKIKTF